MIGKSLFYFLEYGCTRVDIGLQCVFADILHFSLQMVDKFRICVFLNTKTFSFSTFNCSVLLVFSFEILSSFLTSFKAIFPYFRNKKYLKWSEEFTFHLLIRKNVQSQNTIHLTLYLFRYCHLT